MHTLLADVDFHFSNLWLEGATRGAIILGFFILFVLVAQRLIRFLMRKTLGLFQDPVNEQLVGDFTSLCRKVILLYAVAEALACLPIPKEIALWVDNAIFVVVAYLILVGLFDLSNVFSLLVRQKAAEFEILVNRILKIMCATIVLMIVMGHFNYSIWHIMTALGVGTLAVGLAAQPTLTNMIAGFTILLDRPFRVGDHISLTGGDAGDVVSIGMRSTQILNGDGNMLIVSNADIMNTRLVNFSFPNTHMGQKVRFFIAHGSDHDQIKAFAKEAAAKVPGIVPGSLSVLLAGINDWGVEVNIIYSVQKFTINGQVADAIIDSVISEAKKRGIKLATNPAPASPAKT